MPVLLKELSGKYPYLNGRSSSIIRGIASKLVVIQTGLAGDFSFFLLSVAGDLLDSAEASD